MPALTAQIGTNTRHTLCQWRIKELDRHQLAFGQLSSPPLSPIMRRRTSGFSVALNHTPHDTVQYRRTPQSHTPIVHLIDDILKIIFDLHVTRVYRERIKDANALLTLTHVCGWWRELALACSSLWCNIEICRPRLAREFLRRRGTSGFLSFVSSPGQHLPMPSEFGVLLRSAERVRQLDVALLPADMRLFILRMKDYFTNISKMRLIQTTTKQPFEDIHIPHALPSLTQLSLEGVTVRWNSGFKLTVLELCRLSGSKAPSVKELQLMFSNNPQLEKISIDRVFFRPSNISTLVHELPHLRILRLAVLSSCTGHILAGLKTPTFAQIKIKIWDENRHMTSVFPMRCGQFHPCVTLAKTSTLSIRPRRIIIRHSDTPPFSERDVPLVIELSQSTSVAIFPTVSSVFSLFHLTTLELDFMHPDFFHPEAAQESLLFTRNFLSPLLNLVTLRVCQALADILVPVLGESTIFPLAVCPRLAWLSFGDPRQMWWDFPAATNGSIAGSWLGPIIVGLQARHTITRAKLETVEFVGVGHISRDAANHLSPFVDNIFNSVLCPTPPPCTVCSKVPSRHVGWRIPPSPFLPVI